MPVFALGRAQELLLILDEYWGKHADFQKYPIYYASNLARKCMLIYQTYVGAMNDNIKRLFRERMAEAEATSALSRTWTGSTMLAAVSCLPVLVCFRMVSVVSYLNGGRPARRMV
ncbi:hypothetical protein LB503_000599 [Fusarium chuoi]|nr:hypothetical protein LB503_000599 [Fusarium chuoi]